ncbi:MAG: NUDIX hydrolase [Alphaproteobacteria bacterium]|nr:NUDIX hydrolase [Alphaproteobacteria bacterium]
MPKAKTSRQKPSSALAFVEQSAVIPYRKKKKGLEILLVTSLDTGRWVIPKGHIDEGLTARESAIKEAYEEAGVKGVTARQALGAYRYVKDVKKGGGLRRVKVFAMEVIVALDDWPERAKRKRKWMSVNDAAKAVKEKKLSKILESFATTIPKRDDPPGSAEQG